MALQKYVPSCDAPSVRMKSLCFPNKVLEKARNAGSDTSPSACDDVDVDLREVYFLIMHFLSAGPCQRTYGQLWNELLQHQLLPRRYHAWYSRNGLCSNDENDDGFSFPLNYNNLAERYPHVGKNHLVNLLKQLMVNTANTSNVGIGGCHASSAADVPTLIGTGSFSLLERGRNNGECEVTTPAPYMRWPHMQADQLRALALREIGGGFSRHHRAPSIRAACYAIAKPSTLVQKMQNIKKLRGHRNAVYCAIFDRSGRYVVTGSDDRLVKIWSMETAYCLASCRGHEGDITDLAVNYINTMVASSSNDCIIRVWHLPDGKPISVLRGHTGAVSAIQFSPRPSAAYQLLSSSDDGTCRIWDVARFPQFPPKIYVPKPPEPIAGKNNDPSTSAALGNYQIFCLAFNANGTVFATGSSDNFARVWCAYKPGTDDSEQPNHEMDILAGHENDVNYVQFSGCAVAPKFSMFDVSKEDNIPKFKNSWFTHDYIVTCSRDGSAIIWVPRSRRSHGKVGRWTRAYHLKVPPPPLPSLPLRGGPRQRILPTPRGVNMIVWSLDNRFVLAAIMDCRICVWNALDGSLVHSLTGHCESTYVLDVHPFNPRIAMSAGYDGKTIVWDIWEGKPVQIYEIGRFKLIDGKFSPDGTSIILSDDVGQLYILSTGQGEPQKDAKYDQFFLGDYRPLALDTNGSVIDQETQLLPYHRNIQDLLCDSGMLPYPEPYQSMYQRRRLGAMGIEWRSPAVRYAVGTDITLDQEYHMLPMVDLDIMFDPLPEFLDAMDWGPEIEVQTDDNDSEYNVTEEYSNGGKQQSLSSNPYSDDLACSGEEDSEIEDGLRRSKRKKPKAGAEFLSSSGRRIKRRDLDVCDGDSFRTKTKKLKNGKKKKRKSSATKPRPRRVAARNAINLLSRITGASTDEEDEYGSEGEFSESESSLGSVEFDSSSLDEQSKHTKNKDVQLKESLYMVPPEKPTESNMNPGQKKNLIVKFSVPDSRKFMLPKRTDLNCNNSDVHVEGSSSNTPENILEAVCKKINSHNPGFSGDKNEIGHVKEVEGCKDREIQWGGAKARTSKRLRFSSDLEFENDVLDVQYSRDEMDRIAFNSEAGNTEGLNGSMKDGGRFGLIACQKSANTNSNNNRSVVKVDRPSHSMKFKIKRSNKVLKDDGSSSRPEINSIAEDCGISGSDASSATPSVARQSEVPEDYADDNMQNGLINSSIYNSKELDSHLRSLGKLPKNKGKVEDAGGMEESTSNMIVHHHNADIRFSDASNGVFSRTRSVLKPQDCVNNIRHPFEERGSLSGSGITARLRSTKNKTGNFHSSPDTRKSHQATKKLSWLMLSTHEEGSRYIPQKEDEVVYLRQGHEEYIRVSHSLESGPSRSIKKMLRAVEFCKVENLQYSQLPGSGECCCKMRLRFVDSTSDAFGNTFHLTLPEVVNFPDFLVEKSRYDAAIQRNWTFRDKCKVWWENEDDGGGWWEGRIMGQKEKSSEFPDSPWERFSVQYRDGCERHHHSPWELYDEGIQWESPHIDGETKEELLSCLAKLEKSGNNPKDKYGVQKLMQVSRNPNFINRFAVPLSLEVIQSRLANNYYRRLEALEHDVDVMLENANSYFTKSNTEISLKMRRLKDWFTETLAAL